MDPYKILCQWHPTELRNRILSKEFEEKLYSFGLDPGILTVRYPEETNRIANRTHFNAQNVNYFHKDGSLRPGFSTHMVLKWNFIVLWSNHDSSEIELPSGDVIQPSDGSIVLLNNWVCRHRVPQSNQTSLDRWFIRATLDFKNDCRKVPTWIGLF